METTDKKLSELNKTSSLGGDELLLLAKGGENSAIAVVDFASEVLSRAASPDIEVSGTELTLSDAARRALFNDMWKDVGGGYNAATGYYSLNTITDLTYEQAIAILNYGGLTVDNRTTFAQGINSPKLRTFINQMHRCQSTLPVESIFSYNTSVEVIDGYLLRARNMTFFGASKLRKIYDLYTLCDDDVTSVLYGYCPMLEEIGFSRTNRASFNFSDCPKLNLTTFQNIVSIMPTGDRAVTVTVHPDVYAKLTDESNADWHKVLTDGAAKNISFATV